MIEQDIDLVELANALEAYSKPHVGSAWGKAIAEDLGVPMTTPRQEEIIKLYLGGTNNDKSNNPCPRRNH